MNLGTCCICGGKRKVRNVVMLHVPCPTPGKGWGCVQCGLPANGAVAVLCDKCQDDLVAGNAEFKWICTGYPGKDGRTPYPKGGESEFKFEHDLSMHPELTVNN